MIIFCLVFVLFEIANVQAGCRTESYFDESTRIFLQPFNRNKIIRLDEVFTYIVPKGGEVYAYCETGFYGAVQSPNPWELKQNKFFQEPLLHLQCDNNGLVIYDQSSIEKEERFRCKSATGASIHSVQLESCEHQGLFYGITIDNKNLIFAELCYDISNSELVYMHYKLAKRHLLLNNQTEFYPSQDVEYDLRDDNKISLAEVNYHEDIEIQIESVPILPYFKNILNRITFEFDQLVPPVAYAGPLSALIGSINSTNAVPWWTPLKYGNWESYQHLLLKESKKRSFDVYAGTSHIAKYPDELMFENDTPVTINFAKIEKQIPLYIWNYVKSENGEEEFVIIGVNSPFAETGSNSTVICEDMCEKIKFLTPLEATRKLSNFGYMFCCKPDDVQEILNGFPKVKSSFSVQLETTSTRRPQLLWDF